MAFVGALSASVYRLRMGINFLLVHRYVLLIWHILFHIQAFPTQ